MTRRSILAMAAAAAIALAGCSSAPQPSASVSPSESPAPSGSVGPSEPLTTIRVQLSGPIDAEFAGYIAAQNLGYYAAEGLDVQLVPAPTSGDPVSIGAASNGPEFTIATVPQVLAAREKGSDLVDIAQVFQRSGTIVATLSSSSLSGPCDLKGKRVGTWPPPADLEVTSMLGSCDLKPGTGYTAVQVAPEDVTGLLDESLAGTEVEVYDGYARILEATNPATSKQYTTDDVVTFDPADYQSNVLQDAVFARSAWLDATGNGDTASSFLSAVVKGWVYCRDHQEDCVQFTVKAGSGLGTTHQRWMLNEVNALIWPSSPAFGELDAVQWQRTIDVTLNAGLITKRPGTEAFDDTWLQQATGELIVGGMDLTAASFQKLVVAVAPGGK